MNYPRCGSINHCKVSTVKGMGFRAIVKVLKISQCKGISMDTSRGQKMELPGRRREAIAVVEPDEIHSYVGQKKNCRWLWIAVDRYGKRFLAFVSRDRSTTTGLKLWNKIMDLSINVYTLDLLEKLRSICAIGKTYSNEIRNLYC
jgi:hypothetical protein